MYNIFSRKGKGTKLGDLMDNLTGREIKAMFKVADELKEKAGVVRVFYWHGAYYIASSLILIRVGDSMDEATVTSFQLKENKAKLKGVKVGDLVRIDASGVDVVGVEGAVVAEPLTEYDVKTLENCEKLLSGDISTNPILPAYEVNLSMFKHVLTIVEAFKLMNGNIPCSVETYDCGSSNKIIGTIRDQSKASKRGTNICRGEMEVKFTFMTNATRK